MAVSQGPSQEKRITRRDFIRVGGAGIAGMAVLSGLPTVVRARGHSIMGAPGGKRVVIIGGGFGGNFVASTLRKLDPGAEIVVVEKHPFFVSGPASLEYVFGLASLDEITRGYRALMARGIRVVGAEAEAIEPDKNRIWTSIGRLDYNYLVVTSGIRIADEEIAGLAENMWVNAHPYDKSSIVDLRQRIETYRGGNIVMSVPPAPLKCPPGPYECALLFAEMIDAKKLKGKVILIDAGSAPQPPALAKGFQDAINFTYADQIDYVTDNNVVAVEPGAGTVRTDRGQAFKYDLLCIIPPNKAALVIKEAGLGDPFVMVDPTNFRSTKFQNIYAVGDAAATPFTKSAYVASLSGKVCATAIAKAMGTPALPPPAMHNICYPYLSGTTAMMVQVDWHVTVEDGKPKVTVKAASDINGTAGSVALRRQWERGLWREMFGS